MATRRGLHGKVSMHIDEGLNPARCADDRRVQKRISDTHTNTHTERERERERERETVSGDVCSPLRNAPV
jgi:hypothetical protein